MSRAALRLFDRISAPAIGVMGVFALALETLLPLRDRVVLRRRRWPTNLLLGALSGGLARALVVPAMTAVAARFRRRGLLGRVRGKLPPPLDSIAALLLLDYSVYWWHRANHAVPLLWRFHAAHHVDPDLDVSTALRFHPGELLLSIPIRCAVVAALGVTPRQVVIYECMMQTAATFHHANVALPPALSSALSHVVMTPALHGTHHAANARDLDSNWGVVLSLWDRLHRSRRIGSAGAVIGIPSPPPNATSAVAALLLPARARA